MAELFVVLFREGLESLLIVAIAVSYLRQTGKEVLLPTAYAAIGASVAFSIAAGIGLAAIGAMSPVWEGVMALLAAVLILTCVVQMLRLGPKMAHEIRGGIARLQTDCSLSTRATLFGFIFLMIAREGIEAATVIASMVNESQSIRILWGGGLGLIAAALVAGLWARFGKQINLSLFFKASSIFMMLFLIQLVVYAVHEFSEANLLPLVDNALVHIATEPYGPEGAIGAWISYAIVAVPMLFVAYQIPRQRIRGAA